MSASLKLVTLALLCVNLSCLPGPHPGANHNHVSKTMWAMEKEAPSYDLKIGNFVKSVENNITLVGGGSNMEGNVLLNGKPICDDEWDDREAKVVCRMLGFSSDGAFATTQSQFGLVSGDFIMDDVQCKGAETDINDCAHRDKHNCGAGEGAGVRCRVDDDLKEELEEIKDENKKLQAKLSALTRKLDDISSNLTELEETVNDTVLTDLVRNIDNVTQDVVNLKASDQQQEKRIVENNKELKSVSTHGKWCGYQDTWDTKNSVITYDSIKYSSTNMEDITDKPLNNTTGIFTVPMSGAWRVSYSFYARPWDGGDDLEAWIYFNGIKLPESFHHTYSGHGLDIQTGGREVTLAANVGNTIYLRTGVMEDSYSVIYFCVAFEHGPDHKSRLSAVDEDILSPEYQDRVSAGDDDKPRSEFQDNFSAVDEEYFSHNLGKPQSSCSSNADCPPFLACISSVLSSDPGTCGDPWCWREEWDCGSGSICTIVNHKPQCL